MSKSIQMRAGANANGDVGQGLLTSGNTYTVSDGVAAELVNRGLATYTTAIPNTTPQAAVIAGPQVAAGAIGVVGIDAAGNATKPDGTPFSAVASGAIARSTAQLAGTPSAGDIALGANGQFYDPLQTVDVTHPWVYYSASATAYVRINVGGTSTLAGATDVATANLPALNAPTSAALAGKTSAQGIWNLTTNVATAPDGTTTFTPANGVYPASGANFLLCTGVGPRTLDGNTYNAGDFAVMNPALAQWVRSTSSATIAATTGALVGDGAGNAIAGTLGLNIAPVPITLCNVPVGILPDGTIGANGAVVIGTSVGGGGLTFGQSTAGSGVTVTASIAAFAATDVNRFITVGGVTCTITAFTSTTQVAVTIPTGGISSTTWANGTWALGTGVVRSPGGNYNQPGMWVDMPANVITGSNAAGKYWYVASGPVQGTLFNTVYTPGTNTGAGSWHVPSSPTAFSGTTGAAYSSGTGQITLFSNSLTLPPNAILKSEFFHRNNNSAGVKLVQQWMNGNQIGYFSNNQTTSVSHYDSGVLFMKGVTNNVESLGNTEPIHSGQTALGKSYDLSTAQTLLATATRSTVTDWIVIESMLIYPIYGV